MADLFQHHSFRTELDFQTRTLQITWRPRAQWKVPYRLATVTQECEQILGWLSGHLEINALVWHNEQVLDLALSREEHQNLSAAEVDALYKRWYRIILALYALPQTMVFDLGRGVQDLAAEMACAADLRVAHHSCQISFGHLTKGQMPYGGISFLSTVVAPSFVRAWYLLGITPAKKDLQNSGLIQHFYQRKCPRKFLQNILGQAPLARIQARQACLALAKAYLALAGQEIKLATATTMQGDWQQDAAHFIPAREIAQRLQNSAETSC